jgi:hypothetical protein
MKFLLSGRVRWAALGAIVAGLAAGGIAYASIPDTGGVFHACYKNTGAVRLVNSASDCNSSETATQWNQTGPQGSSGPSGPAGADGPSGPSGPSGPGATSGSMLVNQGNAAELAVLSNGDSLHGVCDLLGVEVIIVGAATRQASGTKNTDGTVAAVDQDGIQAVDAAGGLNVDLDVIVRTGGVGPFARIDAHGTFGDPCKFWWMVIPSS